jgi:hypothetical protein
MFNAQIQRRLSATLAAEPTLPEQSTEGRTMKLSIWTRLIVTALAVCTAAALAAPAWGQGGGGAVTLHRDGSKAVPFVAQVGPEKGTAPGDGFDWGDAGIGAGAAVALTAIGLGGAIALGGRRHREGQRASTA